MAGERVFALAALPEGSEGLWIMTSGEVRQVYRRSHANNHFARVVETQLPTNRGNSGGAVVNDRLEVVAVVEGHMQEARLVSLFIDVGEIRDYLAEAVPLVAPENAEAFETRASRRYDEGRYDQAIADYTAALKLDPKLTSAMVNRGWAYLAQKTTKRRRPTSARRSRSIRKCGPPTKVAARASGKWASTTRRSATSPKRSAATRPMPTPTSGGPSVFTRSAATKKRSKIAIGRWSWIRTSTSISTDADRRCGH